MSTRASTKEMAGSQRKAGEKTDRVKVQCCRELLAVPVHGEITALQFSRLLFCQQCRLGFVLQQGFTVSETVTPYLAAVQLKHSPVLTQLLILTLCQSCSCKLCVSSCGGQNQEKKRITAQQRKVISLLVVISILILYRVQPNQAHG